MRACIPLISPSTTVADEDYAAVRGLPGDWTPAIIRERLMTALERADPYLRTAPPELVGLLAVKPDGTPVEVGNIDDDRPHLRKATMEPEVMPDLPEAGRVWENIE